jgi:hypothetical protein
LDCFRETRIFFCDEPLTLLVIAHFKPNESLYDLLKFARAANKLAPYNISEVILLNARSELRGVPPAIREDYELPTT